MKIYKTIIVENNQNNPSGLRKIINENHPEINIVAESNNIETAKHAFLKHRPHIALMDIELATGSSFDILNDLNATDDIDFEVILISPYQLYEYAAKAIMYSVVGLLEEPIEPEILGEVLEKAKRKQEEKAHVRELFAKIRVIDERNAPLIIPSSNHNKVAVSVADITYFKAEGQTTVVYLHDGTSLTAFCILGHFKKILAETHTFHLIHKSLYVNAHQIKSFRYSELEITFKNGHKILASRRYGKDFKRDWDAFNIGKNGNGSQHKGI